MAAISASTAAQHDSWLSMRAELMSSPPRPARLGAVRSWAITSHDSTWSTLHPELVGQVTGEATGSLTAEAPDRGQVLLGVELEALVHVAIQVDGQLGDPQQRPVVPHQLDLVALVGAHPHPPRQPEVAIEPGVEQAPP